MTTGPESPERDPALERAWRAHSREAPPAALDRAILAAAHRAVGSGPAEVAPAREANRPQRWWMPLAAAATIGAVAVGLLQMSPQDASIVAPTERIAAVAPQRELAKAAPAAAPASVPAPAPASAPPPAPAPAAAPAPPGAQAAASAPASRTSPASSASPSSPPSIADAPSRAVPAPASPAAANEALADRKQDVQRPPPPPPAPVVPAMPPRPPAAPVPPASMPGARDAPAVVGKLAERTPDPFPAASAPRKAESAEMKAAAPAADGAASAGAVAGGVAQAARTEPTVAAAEDKREFARKDAAEAGRQMTAAPPPALAAPAPAGSAALRPAPPPPGAEMRARENAAVRDASREQAAPAASALAKRAAPAEDARTKARDPDAWIAQIRKLRDEGRTAEAIRELRDFREFVPDADRRIPPDLRELAAAVRP